MGPAPKPITQYEATALNVAIDKSYDRAVITFIPHGQRPVNLQLPLAALDRFLVQATAALATARSGDAS